MVGSMVKNVNPSQDRDALADWQGNGRGVSYTLQGSWETKSTSGGEPQGCGVRASIFGDYTEAIFAASDKAVGSKGRQDAWRLSPFPSPNKEVQGRYLSQVGRRERWDRKYSLLASLKFCIIWNNAFREKHLVMLNQYLSSNWRISFLVWFHSKVPREIFVFKRVRRLREAA